MQTSVEDAPEVLTTEETADYLKVSPASVRRMIQENRIPYFRIGNRVRILKNELLESLARPRKEG